MELELIKFDKRYAKNGLPAPYILENETILKTDISLDPPNGNQDHWSIAGLKASPTAFKQYSQMLGIPPAVLSMLLIENTDKALALVGERQRQLPKTYSVIRHYDGIAAAIVSEKYGYLDGARLIEAAERLWYGNNDITITSAEHSPDHTYIEVLSPKNEIRILNDIVRVGLRLFTSDTGLSAYDADIFCEVLRCLNGAVIRKEIANTRVIHRGGEVFNKGIAYINTVVASLQDGKFNSTLRGRIKDAELPLPSSEAAPRRLLLPAANKVLKLDLTEPELETANIENGTWKNYWDMANSVTYLANRRTGNEARRQVVNEAGGRLMSMNLYNRQKVTDAALELKHKQLVVQ